MDFINKTALKVDWATYEASKYACVNWHYSGSMPVGKIVKIGIWENGLYIGCILFSRGSVYNIGSPYRLGTTEVCELTRIAMTKHSTPVSRILSIAIKFLHKNSHGLRLVVSYADPDQGHHGGIYQAGNWIYTGEVESGKSILINGKDVHRRSIFNIFGTSSVAKLKKNNGISIVHGKCRFKHKYLMPLDHAMRDQIGSLSKPYPKRTMPGKKLDSEYPSDQGGAVPTSRLQ